MLNKYGLVTKHFSLVAYLSNLAGVFFALILSYFLVYFYDIGAYQLELAVHAMAVLSLFVLLSQIIERQIPKSSRFLLTQNRLYLYIIGFAVASYGVAYMIPLARSIQVTLIGAVILGAVLSVLAGYLRLMKRWITPRERLLLWDNFHQPMPLIHQLKRCNSYELVGMLGGRDFENEVETRQYGKSQVIELISNGMVDVILTSDPEDESLQAFQTELKIKGLRNMIQVEVVNPSLNDLQVTAEDINVERLLDRESIEPDQQLMRRAAHGKRILVTGGGGSIGSEIAQQIAVYEPSLIVLFDQSEYGLYDIDIKLCQQLKARDLKTRVVPLLGSVTDRNRLDSIFQAYQIDTVYHVAAYKHVPMVEHNILEGVRNNVVGTRIVAESAAQNGVKRFVLVSTDKAVRPTNIMGATKRFSELIIQGLAKEYSATCFAAVRFGNVLGSSGSVIPLFMEQIKQGGPVTVTHSEVTRYFMSIREAAQLVIQAGVMAKGGEIYLLEMGTPIKIADLARRLILEMGFAVKESGEEEGIEISFTGLRPGEKLYEELLVDGNARKTAHPRIMVAQEFALDWDEIELLLAELSTGLKKSDCIMVRDALLHAGTGYVPQYGLNDLLWQSLEREADLAAENVIPIFDEAVQKKAG